MSSTNPVNVPHRQSGSRHHSQSLSLGTLNSTHRVTRRKSITANNLSSVAAAMQNIDGASLEALVSPNSSSQTVKMNSILAVGGKQETPLGESKSQAELGNTNKVRNRRASDGGYLSKNEGKRVSGELKCDTCGKGYKHSSCLTKHLLVGPCPVILLS